MYVWVTFQKEGFHCYPAAGTDERLKDVSFLQYKHRHIFHFRVDIEVFHNERDIEIILFKRFCEDMLGNKIELNNKSCETLATEMAEQIGAKYPNRKLKISVSEDNENGAYLEI